MPDIFNNGSKPIKTLDSAGVVEAEPVPDQGDNRSLWEKIQDGWTDFWSKAGDAIDLHNQTANGGYASLVEQPGGVEEIMNIIASPTSSIASGSSVESSPSPDDNVGEATEVSNVDTAFDDALDGSVSVSDYFRNNPNTSPEDLLKFMASQSDEWTEKWMDYVLEKQSIDEQNAYTASREDTAYQRLVEDLRKAGLNPAMMYGSSAGTSASGSVGTVKASEGANSRQLSNYNKLKSLILAYMTYSLKMSSTIIGKSTNFLSMLAGLF